MFKFIKNVKQFGLYVGPTSICRYRMSILILSPSYIVQLNDQITNDYDPGDTLVAFIGR